MQSCHIPFQRRHYLFKDAHLFSSSLHHRLPNKGRKSERILCIASPSLHVSEPYRGPNNPVSGYKLWLPGGGLVHIHATLQQNVVVEAGAVVQESAQIAKNCKIGSGSVIGPNVSIGENSIIGFQAVLQHCSIGANCNIHAGAKIGGSGFVLSQQPDGTLEKKKQDQVFQVQLRDGVEIGANSVVDRGSWRTTVIDKGAMLDSLVHIGHDCTIGRACIICAYASVGPSSSIGDAVVLGQRAAVKDHVSIVSKTRIAAKSGVVRDISEPGDYAGHPAMLADAFKQQVATRSSQQAHAGLDPD